MKFTRTRPEIIKYINKEIKVYRKLSNIQYQSDRAVYVLKELKRFMTENTKWIEE